MKRIILPAIAALIALGSFGVAAPAGSRVVEASSSPSHADFVTPRCRTPLFARACSVAVRYLTALDLDRADEACRLLAPETLQAAGGLGACKKTLLQARGIRIHYRVAAVAQTPLGTTVRFSTKADGRQWLRQQMLVSPAGRIVAVVFEPW
jgi:hypothetical protein